MPVRVAYIVLVTGPLARVLVKFGRARCNADGGKRKV